MISLSGSLRIFLLVDRCDMRKGLKGLYGMVSSSFGEGPRSGALCVFSNDVIPERLLSKVVFRDRDRINVHQDHELGYWSKELGVTPEILKHHPEGWGNGS
jgi:hypothetical protein